MLKKIEKPWLFLSLGLSLLLGVTYSIFSTDPHHWGFIIGTALDVIQGRELFTETYIQYGAGQPVLYQLLHGFLPIHYTSLGVYTSLFYTGTLALLFFGLKRVSHLPLALLFYSAFYLGHPFCIYPWPDYYAGFFLAAACFALIPRTGGVARPWMAGVCFFLAFFFRFTYGLSFIAATVGYGFVAWVNPRVRSRTVGVALASGLSGMTAYLGFLAIQGKFGLWYAQSIGAGNAQYGIGMTALLRLLRNAYWPVGFYLPNRLVFTTWILLFYVATYVVICFLFKKDQNKSWNQKGNSDLLLFWSLLGLGGLAQATLGFEIFRIQNACASLFLVAGAALHSLYPDFASQAFRLRKLQGAMVVYFVLMMAKFPHASSLWPLYDGSRSDYQASPIPLFQGHQFQADQAHYLQGLTRVLCDGKKTLVNLTRESSLAYLCPEQPSGLKLPFYLPSMLEGIDPARFHQIQEGDFNEDELVITDSIAPTHPQVRLVEIGRSKRPATSRWLDPTDVVVYRVERIKN